MTDLNQFSESQTMLQSETENISGEATETSEQTEDLPIASQLINDKPVGVASDNSVKVNEINPDAQPKGGIRRNQCV